MAANDLDRAVLDVRAVLPVRAVDLARLRVLAEAGRPVVSVVGKYNHGKSRLLNELIGSDRFAVADRRETVVLAEHVVEDARWLDAPGLDADVGMADDSYAYHAAWVQADIRLFVHAAREGELDAGERALLQSLHADAKRTQRQTLFVLTQVDQLPDEAHLDQVVKAILGQVPDAAPHPVSATRHRLGVEGAKRLLLEKSGIPALQAVLRSARARVPQARAHETALLTGEIRAELQRLQMATQERREALAGLQGRHRQAFDLGLAAVFDQVQGDLQPVLQVSGTDQALVPDSFANMFKSTAGKQERARLQVAYSHACLAINAHLVRHGVVDLPAAQQTSVRSLDTVMVAVLGVSVKYRDDLRRLFCEPAGRDRLQQEFARYFELSEDRAALARQVVDAEAGIAAAGQALVALRMLGRP
ncbi:MAG: GTPase [Comamonas sp.]